MTRRSDPGYETRIISGTDYYIEQLARRDYERAKVMALQSFARRAQREPEFRQRLVSTVGADTGIRTDRQRRAAELLNTPIQGAPAVTEPTDEELNRRLNAAEAAKAAAEGRRDRKGNWATNEDRESWWQAWRTIRQTERELERRREADRQRENAHALATIRKAEAAAVLLRARVDDLDLERAGDATLIAEARRLVEGSRHLSSTQQERVDAMLRGDGGVDSVERLARHVVATGGPAYRRAWPTALVHPDLSSTEDRRAIMRARRSERRSAGESTSFGYAVPFDLDSSIIGTEGGLAAPVLDHCRREVVTAGDTWHGVTSALGTGYTWAAEDGVAVDNSLTLGQPTLPFYKAMCDVPVSYELLMDYGGAGFEAELAKIFQQEYRSFMGNATLTGSGSGQPDGLFTQLMGTTTNPAHVVATSLGSIELADVNAVWSQMEDKFRANGFWVMHPSALAEIQGVESGEALAAFRYSGQGAPLLRGRPVLESEYAPAYTGSTASTTQLLVLVDLPDGFIVADRMPTRVELTAPAPDPATGRPNMLRFWISWLRVAMGLLDPHFGVILANS